MTLRHPFSWKTPALGIATVALVIGGLWTSHHLAARAATKAPTGITSDGDHYKGSLQAKVVLTEFTDFECPYCQQFHERLKEVTSSLGPERLRIVFRNWPLPFHKDAFRLAVAARCAGNQGRFWEMADAIYDTAAETRADSGKRALEFSEAGLIARAEKMGLNRDSFGGCLKSKAENGKIENDAKEAEKLGGGGTPFILINGKKWEGNWLQGSALKDALIDAGK